MDLFTQGLDCELMGANTEAFALYVKALQKDPSCRQAKLAFARLSGRYADFKMVDQAMLGRFNTIKIDDDMVEFERWLLQMRI